MSHWCEFTKTWPYPEICKTCGEEAPVLYDSDTIFSDTSSSGDETRTDDPFIGKASKEKVKSVPFIGKASKEENVVKSKNPKKAAVKSTPFIGKASRKKNVVKSKKPKKATKKAVEIDDFHKMLFKDFPLTLPDGIE